MNLPVVLLVAGSLIAVAPPESTDPSTAETKVREFLNDKKADGYKLTRLGDGAVARAFPNQHVFSVLFRQFPVARELPAGLRAQNFFFISDGRLELVQDEKQLERAIKAASPTAKAEDVALAALRLVEELHQDGFYGFKTVEEATKAGAGKASAKATVSAGGNGEIAVEVSFDSAGRVAGLKTVVSLKPGPRPICQATKLLDPDPLVRRICEQDLLIMGRPAVDYLNEQAATAPPPLRAEIERVRRAILETDP
jgi:hypothetical protein